MSVLFSIKFATEKPRGVMGCRPISYGFDLYACGFETAYKNVIAPNAYLQGAAEEAFPDNGAFSAFGKAHVCKPFANFPS
jgi:hypothetical protein